MEKKFNVTSPSGKWYITTNANGLKNIFHLHKEALDRIQHETNDGGICKLHFTRITPWESNEYWPREQV